MIDPYKKSSKLFKNFVSFEIKAKQVPILSFCSLPSMLAVTT